ncbi:MAG: serine protease [Eubacterium sp.]|nr:serine protease [Eubacterium sp.]
MEKKEENRERSFINEKIVPRSHMKKILLSILGAMGLGLVFGVVAALAFFTSADLLEGRTETQPSQIIIIRDDTTEAPPEETAVSSAESTTATEETSTEDAGTEPGDGSDAEKQSETEKESRPAEPEKTEPEKTEPPETEPPEDKSLKTVYKKIRNAIVNVRITGNMGTDWFNSERVKNLETFGVIIQETEDYVFVLTDSANIGEEDVITIDINGYLVYATVRGRDERTHICVLRLAKTQFQGPITVMPLGNSLHMENGDTVYMAGAPFKITGAVGEGVVTNVLMPVPVTDGYKQVIYTDMAGAAGGSGILFSPDGEILGWISDAAGAPEESVLTAAGISPLKYLIEDAMSGVETAFLGFTCQEVSPYDARMYEIEEGFYVSAVEENSPAFLAGIQPGDRIRAIDGNPLSSNRTLQVRIDVQMDPEDVIEVELERMTAEGYEPLTLYVTAGSR